MWMPGASIGARNIVAPAGPSVSLSVFAMMIANAAPAAPVISHFVPSMTKSVLLPRAARGGQQHRRVGTGPGAGSVIMKHERISPAASGRSHSSFWRSSATFSRRCMLASSGAKQLSATGAERRIAGRLEDHRLRPVIEPETAPLRGRHAGSATRPAPEPDQLAA